MRAESSESSILPPSNGSTGSKLTVSMERLDNRNHLRKADCGRAIQKAEQNRLTQIPADASKRPRKPVMPSPSGMHIIPPKGIYSISETGR